MTMVRCYVCDGTGICMQVVPVIVKASSTERNENNITDNRSIELEGRANLRE